MPIFGLKINLTDIINIPKESAEKFVPSEFFI